MVAFLDQAVASGDVPSRAALVTRALERKMRRRSAERDAVILREQGAEDDLDNVVTVSTALLGRTIGVLNATQEVALARAIVLAYDLDVPLLG